MPRDRRVALPPAVLLAGMLPMLLAVVGDHPTQGSAAAQSASPAGPAHAPQQPVAYAMPNAYGGAPRPTYATPGMAPPATLQPLPAYVTTGNKYYYPIVTQPTYGGPALVTPHGAPAESPNPWHEPQLVPAVPQRVAGRIDQDPSYARSENASSRRGNTIWLEDQTRVEGTVPTERVTAPAPVLEDDNDIVYESQDAPCVECSPYHTGEPWSWHLLPSALIYRSYLAGAKEPRIAARWNNIQEIGWQLDVTLGARVGILRYGTPDSYFPDGFQVDIEGAAMPRVDLPSESNPLVACDYRIGIPITWGRGPWRWKTGYYHLSSHLGDEFMILNPTVERINYTRDSIMLGVSRYIYRDFRLYAEADYAVGVSDGAEPWEFQFGSEYSPFRPGMAFFAAFNGHLREEVNYGGNFVVQCGIQWRGEGAGHLLRLGGEYYNGKSDQWEFFDTYEQKGGLAIWYDF